MHRTFSIAKSNTLAISAGVLLFCMAPGTYLAAPAAIFKTSQGLEKGGA